MIYNELEKTTIFPLRAYVHRHPDHIYQMSFLDGECVECVWTADYESSNEEEFGISPEDEDYCQFNASGFKITNVIIPGKWTQYGYINLGFWCFPIKIIDTSDNTSVYRSDSGFSDLET